MRRPPSHDRHESGQPLAGTPCRVLVEKHKRPSSRQCWLPARAVGTPDRTNNDPTPGVFRHFFVGGYLQRADCRRPSGNTLGSFRPRSAASSKLTPVQGWRHHGVGGSALSGSPFINHAVAGWCRPRTPLGSSPKRPWCVRLPGASPLRKRRPYRMQPEIIRTRAAARIDAAKFMLWIIATTMISGAGALFSLLAWTVPR